MFTRRKLPVLRLSDDKTASPQESYGDQQAGTAYQMLQCRSGGGN